MRHVSVNWKKSISNIRHLIEKSSRLEGRYRMVACVKKIKASTIQRGDYSHLDIFLAQDGVSYPKALMPNPDIGGYARINVHGKEIIHKDLPMITKTFSWDSPNYGDYSNGSHEVSIDREVYQRSFIPPKNLEIKIELIGQEVLGEAVYVFKFSVDELLDSAAGGFNEELFYNANLLQVAAGAVDIFPRDATREDYLRTIYIGWEILPPGTREETVTRIIGSSRHSASPEFRRRIEQRYRVFERLKPQNIIRGTSGFHRYFGAKFADDFVVFENLDYGNALYVMYDKWEHLSKMSRIDLLKGDGDGFTRIVHGPGWEEKLERLLEKHREMVYS